MKTPLVELWEGVGLGIIISFPSRIHYSNQTGGTSCLHPALEGVYVPLCNDCTRPDSRLLSPETKLYAYFEGPPHQGSGATGGLSEADAWFIESVLMESGLALFLKLDHTRLKDSHEAWVGATLIDEPKDLFSGFGPYPHAAILTWTNTD